VSSVDTSPPGDERWGDEQRARERELLDVLASEPEDSADFAAAREELITMHLPLVHHIARRYRDRGENYDDLVQVGTIGLISSIDRFDIGRGLEFSTFATPTIVGEIKRHFRDRTTTIRLPRRLQELRGPVYVATEDLTGELHRSPTVREIADRVGISPEDVLEVLEAQSAYSAKSLDDDGDDDRGGVASTLGFEDPGMEEIEYRESLRPLLDKLPERERQIIMMRFFKNMSQSEIAEQVGISQMHVSRLLARALAELRAGLTAD
jgi:RNA polymerase sigma-B factor